MNIGDRVYMPVLDADGYTEIKFARVVNYGGRTIAVLAGQEIQFWPRDECFSTVSAAIESMKEKHQTPTPEDLRELDSTT